MFHETVIGKQTRNVSNRRVKNHALSQVTNVKKEVTKVKKHDANSADNSQF